MGKWISILFCVFFTVMSCAAGITNEKLYRKAETHFNNREWNEAMMMYDVLLTENPAYLPLYVSSIIASSKVGASQSVMHYIELSEKNGVSLDSLFIGVERLARNMQDTPIYENMLILMKGEQPWLKKIINGYLLRYYRFRNNYEEIVTIADELLLAVPDNIAILKVKGEALFMIGKEAESVGIYKKILELDSQNTDASLFLGNYYYWKGSEALKALDRNFNDLTSPNRMQYAVYKKEKDSILDSDFASAAYYLEKVSAKGMTPYVKQVLHDIYVQRSEVSKAEALKPKVRKRLL